MSKMTNYCKFEKLLYVLILVEILATIHAQHRNSMNSLNFNQLYRHTDEPNKLVLKPGDSEFGFIDLEIPISLYSKTYSRLYINTNGILTFVNEFPEFINQEFPGNVPSIAPFFANVDTTFQKDSTIISLFKSNNQEKLQKANSLVRRILYFEATVLYVATWENVGYYDGQTDKLNTFQAVIICNSDETYVQFIYPKRGINWIQADYGAFDLPDVPAQAGFVSDDGRHFMINGSGTNNVWNFSWMSNIGINGVFLYRVGLLDYDSNISDEDNGIINNTASSMSCAEGGREICHSSATCIDKQTDFVCKCFQGYYGNGHSCIENTKIIRVSGSVSGNINNRPIDRSTKIESIVNMRKGSCTTAINSIDDEMGAKLKLALPIFSSIGWLFAKPLSTKLLNGYQWTGGNLVQNSELIFKSGETLHINQTFEFVNQKQTIKININGHVPQIRPYEGILIPGYVRELQFTSRNAISSTKEHYIEIPSKNKVIGFQLSENISFELSKSWYDYDIDISERTSLEKVSKTSLNYVSDKHSLRSTNLVTKIGDNSTLNPCSSSSANCPLFSTCITDEGSYKCVCFTPMEEKVIGTECVDIDECENGTNYCPEDLKCVNVLGGYVCNCFEGSETYLCNLDLDSITTTDTNSNNLLDINHRGSVDIKWKEDCYYNPKLCGNNASCKRSTTDPALFECICNPGFYNSSVGDGNICEKENCQKNPSLCDPNANCNSLYGSIICVCNPGYLGNGTTCRKRPTYDSGFLLISRGVDIVRMSFNGKQSRSILGGNKIIGLDKDCIEGRVYWSDISSKIFSAKYDGTDTRPFITEGLIIQEDIAIDSVSRRIYWVDSFKFTIEVASLDDPKMRTVLVDTNLANPRGIAVDPYREKLYWCDWNHESPKIEISNLDGTDRQIFVNMSRVKIPNSLVVLENSGELCFADAGTHKIECIDSYSKKIRTIVSDISYPFALSATDDSFYWTDWTTKKVERVDFDGTRHQGMVTSDTEVSRMYGVIVIDGYCSQGSSPCQINNGGCPRERICLANGNLPSGKSCVCTNLWRRVQRC